MEPTTTSILETLFKGQTIESAKETHNKIAQKMPFPQLIKELAETTLTSMKEAATRLYGKKVRINRKISSHRSIVLDFMIQSESKLGKMGKKKGVHNEIKKKIDAYFKSSSKLVIGSELKEKRIKEFFDLVLELKEIFDQLSLTTSNGEGGGGTVIDSDEEKTSETSTPSEIESKEARLEEVVVDLRKELQRATENNEMLEKYNAELLSKKREMLNDTNENINSLLSKVIKLEREMKKALDIFLYVITFGIYFAVREAQKSDLLEQLAIYKSIELKMIQSKTTSNITTSTVPETEGEEVQLQREAHGVEVSVVSGQEAYLEHSSYVAPDDNKSIVDLFLRIVSRNVLIDAIHPKFTYAYNKGFLGAKNTKDLLKENLYMFMVQGFSDDLITQTIENFKVLFLSKKLKYVAAKNIGLGNATKAIPQAIMVGNDGKARDYQLAKTAKANNFANCNVELQGKYQSILDQSHYFNVVGDLEAYYEAVPISLKNMLLERLTTEMIKKKIKVTEEMVGGEVTQEMVGLVVTDAMVKKVIEYDKTAGVVTEKMMEAGETLLRNCLAKVNEVLNGNAEVKAAAIARVIAARGAVISDASSEEEEEIAVE